MKQKTRSERKRVTPKAILRLPDLEVAKSAVLNSLSCPSAVYAASGVQGACSHRFRHTMATEILELGGTFEEAADILGDSVAIVQKHYAKWSRLEAG